MAEVSAWLEKSGRTLELRVARDLKQAGGRVHPSFGYADSVSGLQREGDVLAQFGWKGPGDVACSLMAVVEVKSGTKHPWVAFYDRSMTHRGDLDNWFYFAHGPTVGVTEPLLDRWYGQEPLDEQQVATRTVTAHVSDTGKNFAGDAVSQVLSACDGLKQNYVRRQATDRVGVVIMPVIVTRTPLVRCSLDGQGQLQLASVGSFHIWGSVAGNVRRRVYVVPEDRLPRFAVSSRELAFEANHDVIGRHS